MATMIVESPYKLDIPPIDIPTYVFTTGTEEARRQPQYFDALHPYKHYSLLEAEGFVKRLGQGLQRHGLKPDDKVLLISSNRLFFPVLLWGTIASGCVFTAASPTAGVLELEYQLRNSGAKLLLTGTDSAQTALKAAAKVGLPKKNVFVFCDKDDDISECKSLGLRSWFDIWTSEEESKSWSWKRIKTIQEAQSTTAILNYSSGTTGLPKGVEITHYNAVANSIQLTHKLTLAADTPTDSARRERLTVSGHRWLAPLPMYHVYGQSYYCMNAVRMGAKVYIMRKFDLHQYLTFMDIYRITYMTGVPVILVSLSKQKHPQNYNLKSLEMVGTGSAPLNLDIAQKVSEMYLRRETQVHQGLGMTETTCSLFGFAPDDDDDGRSVGWLHANCYAKIVPVEGRDFSKSAPAGAQAGEIWASGPNIMKGYFNRPKETSETIVYEDGHRWLRTGDIGYIDERGCAYVIDRLKEFIKVKGMQVAPAELELTLLGHPAVTDAAVVGAKLDGAEYPRAFIVRNDLPVTQKELTQLIQETFAPHKHLTGGIYFIDAIPRTANGKVQRRYLPDPEVVRESRPSKL